MDIDLRYNPVYTPDFLEAIAKTISGIPQFKDRFVFLRSGRITRVDVERLEVDIDIDGTIYTGINISSSGSGPSSGLIYIPEEQSRVVCGFNADDHGSWVPQILQYDTTSPKFELNADIDINPDIDTESTMEMGSRLYRPKLYPGETAIYSADGSILTVNENIELTSADGVEQGLRSEDLTAYLSTVNNIESTGAGRRYTGLIRRGVPLIRSQNSEILSEIQDLTTLDINKILKKYKPYEAINSSFDLFGYTPIVYPSGRSEVIITPKSLDGVTDFQLTGKAFIEDRQELREFHDGVQDVIDLIHGYDGDPLITASNLEKLQSILRTPRLQGNQKSIILIEKVAGTYVGRNILDHEKYAKVLRRKTFDKWQTPDSDNLTSPTERTDFEKKPEFIPCETSEEEIFLSEAFVLNFPTSGRGGGLLDTAFTINKEGKLQVTLSSSSGEDPLASGISMEALLEGAIKAVVGRMSQSKEGIKLLEPLENGYTSEGMSGGQSGVLDFDGSLNINIRRPDESETGFSLSMTGDYRSLIRGNSIERILGTRTTKIDGSDIKKVDGSEKTEISNGKQLEVFGGPYKEYVAQKHDYEVGELEMRVTRRVLEIIGAGKDSKIRGNFKQEVQGSYLEDISGRYDTNIGGGVNISSAASYSLATMNNYNLTAGNEILEDSTFGNHTTVFGGVPGFDAISETIYTTGNIVRNIFIQGDISDFTSIGDISYITAVGKAEIGSLTGAVEAHGTTLAELRSRIKSMVEAPRVVLNSFGIPDSVKIGNEQAAMLLVLADIFIPLYNSHTHMVPQSPSGVNPSTPPVAPAVPQAVSSKVMKVSS